METRINKRTHNDYTQSAAYLPKDLVKNFKHLVLELEIGHSEAMEEAVRMWCEAAVKKVSQP
ncbi:MAG: ribbon-helix-helix protein, CopG family [Nostoc sp.]|uniref:ribbon-helix-helix protein, CopG family n=1 Tax=Nostoc sp. TaxID=1180 RepID=UPI002FFC911E